MPLNGRIHEVAIKADKAYDERDVSELRRIAEECFSLLESEDYNDLEKAILAYHGATSQGNYNNLHWNGMLVYSDDNNNEADFEFSFYLFRMSSFYFNSFHNDKEAWGTATDEDKHYFTRYSLNMNTNYANELHNCGRVIKSIEFLKYGVSEGFPMAVGNLGLKLETYARIDYDVGHQHVFLNEAYKLLIDTMDAEDLDEEARSYFDAKVNELKKYNDLDEYMEYSLGSSEDEQQYRTWCLNNNLFLNTLNDYLTKSFVAQDIMHLPDMTAELDIIDDYKYHGLFNQLKQEYATARFMIYEGAMRSSPHFSDKDVLLYNTLDYPVYGINVEKIKYGYRGLYSLFDRIAFFINDYFKIGIKEKDVNYKTIWYNKIIRGKSGYELNFDLKRHITLPETFNYPAVGLYWIFKDISQKLIKYKYLDPNVERLAEIRNALEHRYLKLHEFDFATSENDSDTLAKSYMLTDFVSASLELMRYVREAIILLSLAVHREEMIRSKSRGNILTVPLYLDHFDDEWK